MEEQMIVAFARMVAEKFPVLEGRSIAVSEVDIFKSRSEVPTLPLAYTALLAETSDQKPSSGSFNLRQEILLQFMFEPVRYQSGAGGDTPFFAFYDYEAIRDRLLTAAAKWRSPRNGGLSYKSLDVSSDEMAVYIAFKFVVTEMWSIDCNGLSPDDEERPIQVSISSALCIPKGNCNTIDTPPSDPCDN